MLRGPDVTPLASGLASSESDRIEQASNAVRGYCRWHLFPALPETVTEWGGICRSIVLPSLMVVSIESVSAHDRVLDPDEYEFDPAGILRGRWWGRVKIEFVHGYDDLPVDVSGVVQAVAQRAVDNPSSTVRQQTGPYSTTYSQPEPNQAFPLALLKPEKALLDPFRLPGRP